MNMRALFFLLLGLFSAGDVLASRPWSSAPSEAGVIPVRSPERSGMSLGRAAEMAKRSVGGGRVLSAEAREQGGRVVYRVKILTRDGEVRYIYVDADSGQVQD